MTLGRLVALLVLAAAAAGEARAQATVSIEGVVRDASGAPVPGATVTVRRAATDAVRVAVTDAQGRYRVVGLDPAPRYELTAELGGFADAVHQVDDLAAGSRRALDVVLQVSGIAQAVEVRPSAPLALPAAPTLGGTLSEEQIERVPLNGRDLVDAAYLIPGAAPARGFYNLAPRLTINGASSLVTNYTVDGFDNTDLFLGGPKVPVTIGATQNLTVLANTYSTEYGRTGNGVFAVTTRSGTNQVTGDAFYTVRPGSVLDSPNFFAPTGAGGEVIDDSFERHQFGGQVGGPIAADRTFYFANAEITRETQDAILTSPLARGLAPTAFDEQSGTVKVDHRFGRAGVSTVRYLFSDYTHDKDVGFIGGLTLPSAGLVVNYRNHFVSWNHRAVVGGGALEGGLLVGRLRANWETPDPGPRVTVTDRGATLAVIGGVSDDFFWTETDLQGRAVFTRPLGRQTVRAGVDVLRGRFDIRPGPGARGSYVIDLEGRPVRPAGDFLALSDLPRDARVLSYFQSFVNPAVRSTQTLAALYAENSIRVHPDATLDLGVRWDYDSVTNTPVGDGDLNNVAPRVGVAWSPFGSTRDQVRAGLGWFYERIPFAVYSDTIFNNPVGGAVGVTFAPGTPFAPPAFPNPFPRAHVDNVPIPLLPPRNVQVFDPDLKSPFTRQISIGYQHELPWSVSLAIDYVDARGSNLIRRVDANAPASVPAGVTRSVAEADRTRPTPPVPGGFRLIERDESTGHSQFRGVYINARKRLSDRVAFDVAWTISKAENDTDDINFRPVDSNDPDAEWGPSLNDRRHVVAINGLVELPGQVYLAPVLFLSTGQPLNVTTGRDDNGDTIFNDRPAGFTRNSERTSGYKQLDLGILRRFAVGGASLEARADVFNVFDTTNFSGFFNFGASGVRPDEAGVLAFQPTAAGPARQFQFSVRVLF